MERFAAHVAALHADGDLGFSREYEAISNNAANFQHSSIVSANFVNNSRNRYQNIVACKYLKDKAK